MKKNSWRGAIMIVPVALLSLVVFAPPASATNAREAMKMCDARAAKSNDCGYSVDSDGGVGVCVGKNQNIPSSSACEGGYIYCPKGSDCVAMVGGGSKIPKPNGPKNMTGLLMGQ